MFILRRELTDEITVKPLKLGLWLSGTFMVGVLIGGGTMLLAISVALA